ncbi:hypothetical protein CCICO_08015 [Corynebacterium ciconiae DSM 44920]|uniref:hypothetical protein n=1 Tax=Corynebacterium ciconiae TaxID=227319 RepID=UPI00036AC412|nr:hypothetical protein [Corynebacterium ciconiae]WKD61619.1 hypothetical protein CCICO_08015 [Corynebacterium ciconiae DSM 44920]
MKPADFEWTTRDFVASLYALLEDCFPDQTDVEDLGVSATRLSASTKLRTPLRVRSLNDKLQLVGVFKIGIDSSGSHIAVKSSSFRVLFQSANRNLPIVRFEFDRDARNKPASHFHFHSDSVPLALLLARAGRYDAAAQQHKVHFPMGGVRYRICLEDVIELLVNEFGVEARPGWRERVCESRLQFDRLQTDTVIRKNLSRAVELLQEDGYSVSR